MGRVPLNRPSFTSPLPAGHTSSAIFKALLRYLDATKGHAAGDAWLKTIRMERDDLDDETRPLPVSGLHAALLAFVDAASRDAIQEVWPHLIGPDNLGGWMRVLRGTTTPIEAFAQLDAGEGEYGRTTRWETVGATPGVWRGRVHISHEASLETDGLLRLARMAELSIVPALFGYGRASVTTLESSMGSARQGLTQEFEVRWRIPNMPRASAFGGALGGALGSLPLVLHPSPMAVGWPLLAMGLGAAVGLTVSRDGARKAETFAQSMRVRALERSLLLRETRESQSSGIEGSVVAGQYRIGTRMGSGASGVIYQATRVSDGLRVAVKLLRAVAAHDAIASDRLRREAEALRLAWHPNVVEVLDHGLLGDGTAYLVMELLDGEPLATRIESRGRLSPAELLPIAMQVCDAMVAVHAAGVVHRDLKPSNIVIVGAASFAGSPQTAGSAPGGGGPAGGVDAAERVKLIDFGIARVEWEETRITHTGVPLGTPGYMAPEQEAGGEVDARSDIFALGACMYEALVGEPPPPTPSGLWVASPLPGQQDQPAASVRDGAADRKGSKYIPPAWQVVIERAMSPLPRDRYPDARSLAQALRELGAGLGASEASSSR